MSELRKRYIAGHKIKVPGDTVVLSRGDDVKHHLSSGQVKGVTVEYTRVAGKEGDCQFVLHVQCKIPDNETPHRIIPGQPISLVKTTVT